MAFLTQAANRGSVSTGYTIENSLKFEGDNTEYLSYTNTVGEGRRTWTYSTWVKITEVENADDCRLFAGHLSVNDRCSVSIYQNQLQLFGKTSGVTAVNVRASRKLRDPSAWYHLMIVLDTNPSGTTSFPIPSPGIDAILYSFIIYFWFLRKIFFFNVIA